MKQGSVIVAGIILVVLYLVPSVNIEELDTAFGKIKIDGLVANRTYVGTGLLIVSIVLIAQYIEKWIEWDRERPVPIIDHDERIYFGWNSSNPDKADRIVRGHIIKLFLRVLFNYLPSSIILVVTVKFLWQIMAKGV